MNLDALTAGQRLRFALSARVCSRSAASSRLEQVGGAVERLGSDGHCGEDVFIVRASLRAVRCGSTASR
jgi:hypothetical protein